MTKGTSKELGVTAQTIQVICKQFAQSRDKKQHSLRFRVSSGPRRSLGWVPFQKQCVKISGNSVTYLGKQFRWFGSKCRVLPENAKGGAFIEDARGRWYVCFQVEVRARSSMKTENVGIDLGLKSLATLSNGIKINATQPYRKYENKLAIVQRANNKKRTKSIHARIANCRKDYLHKESTKIVKEFGFIAVGNVSPSQLSKTRLSKSITDASWSMFRNQLRYKARRHGVVYMDVDEKFTTQVCSCCLVNPNSSPKGRDGLGIRNWVCSECGESHDRDVNSAKNILRIGLSVQPPVEGSLIDRDRHDIFCRPL